MVDQLLMELYHLKLPVRGNVSLFAGTAIFLRDTPLWRGLMHLLITWIARTIRAVKKYYKHNESGEE